MSLTINQPFAQDPEILRRLARCYLPTSDIKIFVEERVIEGSFRKTTEAEQKINEVNSFMLCSLIPHYFKTSSYIHLLVNERGEIYGYHTS